MTELSEHRRKITKSNTVRGTLATVESDTSSVTLPSCAGVPFQKLTVKGNTIQRLLPSEYQEVEFIQSVLKQGGERNHPYIDTGIIPTVNIGVNIIYQSLSYKNSQYIIGARNRSGGTIFYGLNGSSSQVSGKYLWTAYINGTSYQSTMERSDHKMQSVLMPIGNGAFEWKLKNIDTGAEETKNISATTINTTETIKIFGLSDIHTLGGLKGFECQIYDSGNLVRHYIAVYRKSDNVIGLYDLVQKTFNTSPNGEFVKGADIQRNIAPTPEAPQEIVNTSDLSVELSVNESTTTVQIPNVNLNGIGEYKDILSVNYIDKTIIKTQNCVYADLSNVGLTQTLSSNSSYVFFTITGIPIPRRINTYGIGYCNRCKWLDYDIRTEGIDEGVISVGLNNNALTLYISQTLVSEYVTQNSSGLYTMSVDNLRTWLESNPIQICYVATMQNITYGADEYSWVGEFFHNWKQLCAPYGQTGIIKVSADLDGSGVSASYYSLENEDKRVLTISCIDEEGNMIAQREHHMRAGTRYKVIAPEIVGYLPLESEFEGDIAINSKITIIYKEN